jgi:Na+/H+-dicarboxylate symporter
MEIFYYLGISVVAGLIGAALVNLFVPTIQYTKYKPTQKEIETEERHEREMKKINDELDKMLNED